MRRVIGVLLVPGGMLFAAGSLVALADPVGTRMADDAGPFGDPGPWHHTAPTLAGSVAMITGGAGLALRGRRRV